MPKPIKPMLCERRDKPPVGENWIFEEKYDGIRAIVTVDNGVAIQARSGSSKTGLFPELKIVSTLPAVFDGEIISGEFNDMQHRMNRVNGVEYASKAYPSQYMAFDVLWVKQASGWTDIAGLPWDQRRMVLTQIAQETENFHVAPTYTDGQALFDRMKAANREGIIAKMTTLPYHEDKRAWVKVKVLQRGVFFICGFTQGTGWRANTFGALVLGELRAGELRYVGEVGTGFDNAEIERLNTAIRAKITNECPFPKAPLAATWIKPELICAVEFLERTKDRSLRFPSYKGLV